MTARRSADTWQSRAVSGVCARAPAQSKLEPFKSYLKARLQAGV